MRCPVTLSRDTWKIVIYRSKGARSAEKFMLLELNDSRHHFGDNDGLVGLASYAEVVGLRCDLPACKNVGSGLH